MIPAARVFYPARPPALPVRPFSSGSTPLRSAPTFTYRFPQAYTHRLTAQLPLRSDGSTGREHRESSRTFARRGDFPDLPPFQSHPGKIVKSKRASSLEENAYLVQKRQCESRDLATLIATRQYSGDLPVFIKCISNEGAAGRDSRLKMGDQLLAVNGVSFENVTHQFAAETLKYLQGDVELTVLSTE